MEHRCREIEALHLGIRGEGELILDLDGLKFMDSTGNGQNARRLEHRYQHERFDRDTTIAMVAIASP